VTGRPSRLLVFDSGLGGLSVVRALRDALPEASIRYLADDAGFPYGDLPGDVLAERVAAIVGAAIAEDPPDAAVIACNTASTVALPVLRARHSIPFVGTIRP
jgi:glutamate racemase